MVAGLAARFDGAFLFAFEEFDKFRDCCFFNTEPLLTGMSGRAGKIANPR